MDYIEFKLWWLVLIAAAGFVYGIILGWQEEPQRGESTLPAD